MNKHLKKAIALISSKIEKRDANLLRRGVSGKMSHYKQCEGEAESRGMRYAIEIIEEMED